jgi:hypothetical protein
MDETNMTLHFTPHASCRPRPPYDHDSSCVPAIAAVSLAHNTFLLTHCPSCLRVDGVGPCEVLLLCLMSCYPSVLAVSTGQAVVSVTDASSMRPVVQGLMVVWL